MRRPRALAFAGAAALVLGCGAEQPEDRWWEGLDLEDAGPRPGQLAPEFALQEIGPDSVGAVTHRLSDYRGSFVMLSFWATGCGPCVEEHGTLNAIAEEYADRGVRFLGIVTDDTPRTLARFYERFGPTAYPNVSDSKRHVNRSYEVFGIPRLYLIDPDGRVVWRRSGGPVKPEWVTAPLDSALRVAAR